MMTPNIFWPIVLFIYLFLQTETTTQSNTSLLQSVQYQMNSNSFYFFPSVWYLKPNILVFHTSWLQAPALLMQSFNISRNWYLSHQLLHFLPFLFLSFLRKQSSSSWFSKTFIKTLKKWEMRHIKISIVDFMARNAKRLLRIFQGITLFMS